MSVPQTQHQKFNQMLNQLHTNYSRPDYPHARIEYKHVYLVDSFYPLPGGGGGRDKLRVSVEGDDGKTVGGLERSLDRAHGVAHDIEDAELRLGLVACINQKMSLWDGCGMWL